MQKPEAMSKFEATFRNAVANAERDVMIEQIRSNPQMSLSELGKLATGELGPLLKGITIGEILGQIAKAAGRAAGGKAARSAAPAPAKSSGGRKGGRQPKGEAKESAGGGGGGGKRGGGSKGVDTRTPAGREAYDQAMLNALKGVGKAAAAPELAAAVGGTPLQIRTSLARLIERGLVNWTGQARGTRYTAV